jgi:nucleoid DNA-binding protein
MAEKLTKAELVEALQASQGQLTRKDIHECVDGLLGELKNAMLAGKAVDLRGFGSFEVRRRKGKTRARNPKTGEIAGVEDHGVAAFRPGRELRMQA